MTTDLGVNSSRGLVMMGRTSTSPRRGGGGGGAGGGGGGGTGTYTSTRVGAAGGAPTPLDSSSVLESSLGLPAGAVGMFSTEATAPAAGGSTIPGPATAVAVAVGLSSKRRYECHICHRDFPFPSKLAEHLRTHTGEKPFACPYCSFRASLKWNLKSHIQSQHTAQQAFLGQQPQQPQPQQ